MREEIPHRSFFDCFIHKRLCGGRQIPVTHAPDEGGGTAALFRDVYILQKRRIWNIMAVRR